MINDLKLKLNGKIPVTREELFTLISSWGRTLNMNIESENIEIKVCEPNQKYPLENLDVSQITDFYLLFLGSLFNGDRLNWNTSNVIAMERMFDDSIFNGDISSFTFEKCTNINCMFWHSNFNNNSIKNWDVSNIENMFLTFSSCSFDGDLSKWNINKDVDMAGTFNYNKNFLNKYNDGKLLSNLSSEETVEWFLENQFKMSNINVTQEEILDIDDYLNNHLNKEIEL